MLNRRHIRIKVMHILYAFYQDNNQNVAKFKSDLQYSISSMYEIYLYYLFCFEEFIEFEKTRLEEGKNKLVPSQSDLKPNYKLINNAFLKALIESPSYIEAKKQFETKIWSGDVQRDILKKMYVKHVVESPIYREYIQDEQTNFQKDGAFIIKLFKKEICDTPLLLNFFDEQNVFWADDVDHVCSMIIKTLKKYKNHTENAMVLPLFKDDEEAFLNDLFRLSIEDFQENTSLIKQHSENWEEKRIALIDKLLMSMAICEAVYFPTIPLNVTLNEYIEIAKSYSTPKSNVFINGVLEKIYTALKTTKKIIK